MTGLVTVLVIVGIIFIVGSFFITEKIAPEDARSIAKTNMTQINDIMDKEINSAIDKGKENLSVEIEDVILNAERSMEKESNEKIMAINEYSDTVLESMDKTHKEIMFLYSMLNDKHKELTDFAGELNELQAKLIRTKDYIEKVKEKEEFESIIDKVPVMPAESELIKESVINSVAVQSDDKEADPYFENEGNQIGESESLNHNEEILALYNEGKDEIEIAKELGLGFGEVKLVLELYKEQ